MLRRAWTGSQTMNATAFGRNTQSIHIIEDTYLFIMHTYILLPMPRAASYYEASITLLALPQPFRCTAKACFYLHEL